LVVKHSNIGETPDIHFKTRKVDKVWAKRGLFRVTCKVVSISITQVQHTFMDVRLSMIQIVLKVVLVKAKDIFDFLFESLVYCKPKLTVWDHDECMRIIGIRFHVWRVNFCFRPDQDPLRVDSGPILDSREGNTI
jgi:hypothetical protein